MPSAMSSKSLSLSLSPVPTSSEEILSLLSQFSGYMSTVLRLLQRRRTQEADVGRREREREEKIRG